MCLFLCFFFVCFIKYPFFFISCSKPVLYIVFLMYLSADFFVLFCWWCLFISVLCYVSVFMYFNPSLCLSSVTMSYVIIPLNLYWLVCLFVRQCLFIQCVFFPPLLSLFCWCYILWCVCLVELLYLFFVQVIESKYSTPSCITFPSPLLPSPPLPSFQGVAAAVVVGDGGDGNTNAKKDGNGEVGWEGKGEWVWWEGYQGDWGKVVVVLILSLLSGALSNFLTTPMKYKR